VPVVGIKERNSGKNYVKIMLPNNEGDELTGKQLIAALDTICRKKWYTYKFWKKQDEIA
jgi:hypothetical protein